MAADSHQRATFLVSSVWDFTDSGVLLDKFRETMAGKECRCEYEDGIFAINHPIGMRVAASDAFLKVFEEYIKAEKEAKYDHLLEVPRIFRQPETEPREERNFYEEARRIIEKAAPEKAQTNQVPTLFGHENYVQNLHTNMDSATAAAVFTSSILQEIDMVTNCRIKRRDNQLIVRGDSTDGVHEALRRLHQIGIIQKKRLAFPKAFDFVFVEAERNCRLKFQVPKRVYDRILGHEGAILHPKLVEVAIEQSDTISSKYPPNYPSNPTSILWHDYIWPRYGLGKNSPIHWTKPNQDAAMTTIWNDKTNALTRWNDTVMVEPEDPDPFTVSQPPNQSTFKTIDPPHRKTRRVVKAENDDPSPGPSQDRFKKSFPVPPIVPHEPDGTISKPTIAEGTSKGRNAPYTDRGDSIDFTPAAPTTVKRPESHGNYNKGRKMPYPYTNRGALIDLTPTAPTTKATRKTPTLGGRPKSSHPQSAQQARLIPQDPNPNAIIDRINRSKGKAKESDDAIATGETSIGEQDLMIFEKLRVDDERDTRVIRNNPNLKAPIAGNRTNVNTDDLAREVRIAVSSILDVARSSYRSQLVLEAAFGRVFVDRDTLQPKFLKQSFSSIEWPKCFREREGGRGADTHFFSTITTAWPDAEFISNLKAANNERIFDEKSFERRRSYQIFCIHNKTKVETILEVDDQGNTIIRKHEQQVGSVNLHCAKRTWDARIAVKEIPLVNLSSQDPLGQVLEHLWIGTIPGDEFETVFTRIGGGEVKIKDVFVRSETSHKILLHPDLTLRLTEVQQLQLNEDCVEGFMYKHPPQDRLVKLGLIWWEASVTSKIAERILKDQSNISIGDTAEWTPEDILGRGVVESMVDIVKQVVTRINSVGTRSLNYSLAREYVYDPNRSGSSLKFSKASETQSASSDPKEVSIW